MNTVVAPVVHTKVRKQVLACLPSPGGSVTLQHAIKGVSVIQKSARDRASSPVVQGEVDGVATLLSELSMGISPEEKDIDRFSEFFKSLLKCAEGFYTVKRRASSGVKESDGVLVKLHGREALLEQFEKICEDFRFGVEVRPAELQPLKTCSWIFCKNERQQVQEWIASAAAREVAKATAVVPAASGPEIHLRARQALPPHRSPAAALLRLTARAAPRTQPGRAVPGRTS